MNEYTLSIEDKPESRDIERLGAALTDHAVSRIGVAGFQPLGAFLRELDGTMHGGAFGYVNWNWLCVALVWLPQQSRGRGLGRRVLEAIEAAARERGCVHAHLDTFSWQARPLYEKLGYEVFATLDDYPPGQQRFYMKKAL